MNKKRLVSFFAMLLALALIFSAVPVSAESSAYVKDTGIGKINLRSGPATQYRVLAALAPNTPLNVAEVIGKWAHVYLRTPTLDGVTEGYIYTDYIEYYTSPTTADSVPYGGNKYVTEYTTMYVYTGNGGGLHLREEATLQSLSLGLFPNGTKVIVLNRSGDWAYVDVGGLRGFMMLAYLSVNQHYDPQPIYVTETKYISTGNSGRLHLREYPSQNARSLGLFPNGTMVSAKDLGTGWSYVAFGSYTGYMMTKFLSPVKPNISPTPYNPGGYKIKYVRLASGYVSLRSEMSDSAAALGNYSNGTVVYVVYDFGAWSFVFVDGKNGYMKNSWLADSPYVPDPQPVTPIGSAVVQHPNGSFVYLRSSRSTANLSNVLAKVPSGSWVKVYQKDEWYSLIEYNGIKGYMVSSYLYSGAAPVPVPSKTPEPTGITVIKMIVGGTPLRSSRDESGSGNIITQLPHGAMVEILLTYPDDWRYVSYNGLKGYIHGQVVASVTTGTTGSSPLMPTVPESPVIGTAIVQNPNSTFVNLRYSRNSNDNTNVLVQVPVGAKVEVMEQSGSWSKVRYNGVVGYMVSSYVPLNLQYTTVPLSVPSSQLFPAQIMPQGQQGQQTQPIQQAQPVQQAQPIQQAQPRKQIIPVETEDDESLLSYYSSKQTSSSSELTPGQHVVHNENSSYVYMRSSKSTKTDANVLMKVPNGTTVQVLEVSGSWARVQVQGIEGYIVAKYLK